MNEQMENSRDAETLKKEPNESSRTENYKI